MSSDMIRPFGQAKDGKIFNWTTPEVIEQCNKYGFNDVDEAIANAIEVYNKTLPQE